MYLLINKQDNLIRSFSEGKIGYDEKIFYLKKVKLDKTKLKKLKNNKYDKFVKNKLVLKD